MPDNHHQGSELMRLLRRNRSRGQALVEFALTVPIFFLLLFGLIDLGRAVYVNNSMSQAAREAGRWGSVQARSATDAGRAAIADMVQERMEAVPDATVTVTCVMTLPSVGCRINDILVVEVVTELQMITPIVGQITGDLTLSTTSRVVVNN
jgi:Flp pilus assembly protein TadG